MNLDELLKELEGKSAQELTDLHQKALAYIKTIEAKLTGKVA